MVQKISWVQRLSGPKNFGQKIPGQGKLLFQKSLVQKNFGPQKSRTPKNCVQKVWLKIRSVTAEIFWVWTYIYVHITYMLSGHMMPGQMSL